MEKNFFSAMRRKAGGVLIAFFCWVWFSASAFAQSSAASPPPEMLEGEFARQLVKLMKLERLLPPGPSVYDHISLLEQFGISPLGGWEANQKLSREDYVVILAFASGKEKIVYEKAQEACDRNVEVINTRRALKEELEGRQVGLEELFGDPIYFPKGAPHCPYHPSYKDKNHDGNVEPHRHEGYAIVKRKLAQKSGSQ